MKLFQKRVQTLIALLLQILIFLLLFLSLRTNSQLFSLIGIFIFSFHFVYQITANRHGLCFLPNFITAFFGMMQLLFFNVAGSMTEQKNYLLLMAVTAFLMQLEFGIYCIFYLIRKRKQVQKAKEETEVYHNILE